MQRTRVWLMGMLVAAISSAAAADPPSNLTAPAQRCLNVGAIAESALEDQLMSRIGSAYAHEAGAIRSKLADLEVSHGPRDERLLSPLIWLGLKSQESGDEREAARAFAHALLVIRANEGLQSLNQLPVINLLINAKSGVQDWHGVSAAYGLMHWLYRRSYAVDDPRVLPGLKRLRQWHIDAYNKETGIPLAAHVEMADRLYSQAEAILLQCAGDNRLTPCFMGDGCCPGMPGDSCAGDAVGPDLNSAPLAQSK